MLSASSGSNGRNHCGGVSFDQPHPGVIMSSDWSIYFVFSGLIGLFT